MRKYIHMAKAIKPQLTVEASEYISERYSELRSADIERNDRERVIFNNFNNILNKFVKKFFFRLCQ